MSFLQRMLVVSTAVFAWCSGLSADEARLAESVRKIKTHVLTKGEQPTKEERDKLRRMLSNEIRTRRRKVNAADVKAWRSIKTLRDWYAIRDKRRSDLIHSVGGKPSLSPNLGERVTKHFDGDGFVINNVIFNSRFGSRVTANLYAPEKPRKSMPGILICHSHHNPKTQGELQDMGMIWARAGCYVLVMDQLGHGERRWHPFHSAKDYAKRFRVSRQDYYFRYNLGIQFNLLGHGLIGAMAHDLMGGVSLVLKQPGIDKKRIILLGAVAGGGDPCAVAAAIDDRITAAVPFNFGGPQPESIYPLPKDADLSFNYMGGGSWESTRNLRRSGSGGFLPWVIVGSIAPRRLIYAHEFSWDKERDPVWKRLKAIYKLHGKPENLASAHGYGKVSLPSSKASHCNNIGAYHRKAGIYAAFEKWFGIPVPKSEYRKRLDRSQLHCIPDVKKPSAVPKTRPAQREAKRLLAILNKRLLGKKRRDFQQYMQQAWRYVLGDVKPVPAKGSHPSYQVEDGIRVYRHVLESSPGIKVPLVILTPHNKKKDCLTRPVVVCVSQAGKAEFLKNRADVVAKFLAAGYAVCIPDLRGTGETRPGTYRGRRSYATGLSSTELMLGGTMVGKRLKDLRSVLALLRSWKAVRFETHRLVGRLVRTDERSRSQHEDSTGCLRRTAPQRAAGAFPGFAECSV